MNKYLTRDEIDAIIGKIELPKGFQIMSQDSYNETKIAESIKQTGQADTLLQCAINLATVGFGNKRYGNYRVDDKIIDIATTLKNCNVKLNNGINAQLREDDLTPQRLCRFYRYHIRDYIQKNKVSTYLFRKYTDRNLNYFDICFRGAEYLDDLSDDQLNYLLTAVRNLDLRQNSNVYERVIRITEAKKGIQNRIIAPS